MAGSKKQLSADVCEISGTSHEWVSDGHGCRYCDRCLMDHPVDLITNRRSDIPEAVRIMEAIDAIRIEIDTIKNLPEACRAEWGVVQKLLDEPRKQLQKIIGHQ